MARHRPLPPVSVALILALGLLLAQVPAEARPEYQFGITVEPSSGRPGITVTVSGYGWLAMTPGEIHWDSSTGPLLGTFTPNPNNGTFTTTVTIPGDATAGQHTIWACDRCGSRFLIAPERWVSAPFTVLARPTATPTATPVPPSECDATGLPGETVIDFEGFPEGTNLRGQALPEGVIFDPHLDAYVVDPAMAVPRSGRHGLQGDVMIEFGSGGRPMRFTFSYLVESIGMFVGLDEAADFDEPLLAQMTAYGIDPSGYRYRAGRDSVNLGPAPENIHRCLFIRDPRIYEIILDYSTGNPELIDDLIFQLPEIPVTPPPDDDPPEVTILQPAEGAVFGTSSVRLEGEVLEDRELATVEVIVNGSEPQEIGFSSAGDAADGRKRYIFALDPLSRVVDCEDEVVVVATDLAGNEGVDVSTFRVLVGDLTITRVDPVQVVFGAPLVMGKNTAFRATVTSTFACPVEVPFRIELPPDEWDTSLISAITAAPGSYPPGWHLPEISLPAAIPAFATDLPVMLPVVSPGMEEAAWDEVANPSGMIGFIRQVPRPIRDGVRLAVEIDPENALPETEETNNRIEAGPYSVVDTRGLNVMFVPWIMSFEPRSWESESQYEWYLRERGYADASSRLDDVDDHLSNGRVAISRALSAADVLRLRNVANEWAAVFLGGFPVAETEFQMVFNHLNLFFLQDYLTSIGVTDYCWGDAFRAGVRAELLRADPQLNAIVLEMIAGCCGQSGDVPETVFVDAGRGFIPPLVVSALWGHYCGGPPPTPGGSSTPTPEPWYYEMGNGGIDNILHEFSHNYVGSPDCYNCWTDAGSDCASCVTDADGFWVNRWLLIPEGTLSFMHAVDTVNVRWWRLDPILSDAGVPDTDGYLNLVEAFRVVEDPEAILVSGRLNRDGTAAFDSLAVLDEAVLDLQEGSPGSIAFVLQDAGGNELVRAGFSPSFEVMLDPQGAQAVDEIAYVYRIPWDPATAWVELQDSDGNVLARRAVSASPPTVELLSPAGGETWTWGAAHAVRWQAGDPDGDPLTAAIHASLDGGETWVPLASGIEGEEYRLDAAVFEEGQSFLIRVVVNDGVYDSSATVSAALIAEAGPSIPRSYRVTAVTALAVVAVGVVAVGLLVGWRSRRRSPKG